jgi:choline-sulfatase
MKSPNLVIFLSDQHSPHILGCGGDAIARTPHLDALAARGVIFDNCYSAAPVCVPSRMTFLTAQYPSDIDVWTNSCLLDSQIPTFAHALSLAGYETVLCGRMHFAGRDQHHGFEKRLVGDISGAMIAGFKWPDVFEHVFPIGAPGQSAASHQVVGSGKSTYMAYDEAVTQRAIEYLQTRDSGRPFCLVIGHLLPHNPYICPKELFDEYIGKISVPELPARERTNLHPAVAQLRQTRDCDSISPEHARRARASYYGLVTLMDENVGRVLEALESTPEARNTAIAYTSDHGEMAGEHGLWWKETFYDGACRVPLIWAWPENFRSGVRVQEVTSLLDIGPTCLDLAGAASLPRARGRSLRPLLTNAACDETREAFAETFAAGQKPARMIRCGDWKLNWYHGYDFPQLFDLRNDPDEKNDLGRDENYAAIREKLLMRVRENWSAEHIENTITGRKMTREWSQKTPLTASELWRVPPGSNALDEI